MGIGKGENKATWEDFLKSQQGVQVKKSKGSPNKVSGSNTPAKDGDADKNGGGTEGAAATDTTKE